MATTVVTMIIKKISQFSVIVFDNIVATHIPVTVYLRMSRNVSVSLGMSRNLSLCLRMS